MRSDPEHGYLAQPGPTVVVPVRSRWNRSEVTFGPVGRVVATVAIVAPLIFMLVFSLVFLIAGLLLLPVAWMALKQIWQPVKVDTVRLPGPLPPTESSTPSIMDREAPQRW